MYVLRLTEYLILDPPHYMLSCHMWPVATGQSKSRLSSVWFYVIFYVFIVSHLIHWGIRCSQWLRTLHPLLTGAFSK